MGTRSKGMVYLAILSLIWGASFLLIKIAVESIPPLPLATARMAVGAICLYLFLKIRGDGMPRIGKEWVPFLVLGVSYALLPAILISYGEKSMSSGLTSVLNSTVPIMTVILAHFLVDEQLTTDRAIGIAVGFIGVIMVLLPALGGGVQASLTGPIAVVLAALLIALATIYARKYQKGVPPVKTSTGMMATAAIVGLPLVVIFEEPLRMRPSTESLLALVALGVFCSAIAFLLYYWLVANRGATYASLVMFTQPPVAIILAAIFLGSVVKWTTIAGMAIILLSIAIMDGFLDRLFHHSAKTSSAS
jgi:drug/metabolite transporter (DMT)-like permease